MKGANGWSAEDGAVASVVGFMLLLVLTAIGCFLGAIWSGDGRWGWTGLVLCGVAVLTFLAGVAVID